MLFIACLFAKCRLVIKLEKLQLMFWQRLNKICFSRGPSARQCQCHVWLWVTYFAVWWSNKLIYLITNEEHKTCWYNVTWWFSAYTVYSYRPYENSVRLQTVWPNSGRLETAWAAQSVCKRTEKSGRLKTGWNSRLYANHLKFQAVWKPPSPYDNYRDTRPFANDLGTLKTIWSAWI